MFGRTGQVSCFVGQVKFYGSLGNIALLSYSWIFTCQDRVPCKCPSGNTDSSTENTSFVC